MQDFKDRLYVITGAAKGLGACQARQLVKQGARVVLTDVDLDAGESLAAELGEMVSFFSHDVSNSDHWDTLTEAVIAKGGMHGLVNNAGIFDPKPVVDTSPELFERHMKINQLGTFLGLKFAALAASETGASVVNMSSLAGLRGPAGIAYVGTKWAVRGMTKTAALELAPQNIRVNSVHPAFIDTAMLQAMSPENYAQRLANIPLGRAGTVDDVAKLVLFLLSDDSSYITGAEIAIDGGLSI